MTLTEFDNMRMSDASGHKGPTYVFDTDEIYDCNSWEDVRSSCELICALASDFKASTYLIPKYANANVWSWGIVYGHVCIVIEEEE